MKLAGSKGVKGGQWVSNEIFRADDISFVHQSQYQNASDKALLEALKLIGGDENIVLSGLELVHDADMNTLLSVGEAISTKGTYLATDTWGYTADITQAFYVQNPAEAVVSFNNGDATNPRIDILEIRPTQESYNPESRQFKDPITDSITSALTNTRMAYGVEIQVTEGTPAASPSAPSTTAGWIKLAEVTVAATATSITDSNIITYKVSDTWDADISSTTWDTRFVALTAEVDAVTADVDSLAGVGRTTETVKQNADDIAGVVQRTVVSSDTTLASNTAYLVNGDHELTLPTTPAVGDIVEVLANGYPQIVQDNAEHSIIYKNKYSTTKGVTGAVRLFDKDKIALTYLGTGLSPNAGFTKLSDPSTVPGGTGEDVAFSYDGVYLAVVFEASPYLIIYKRSGDVFTKLADPAGLPVTGAYGACFSYDGVYLAVAQYTSPFINIYKRSGDTFTRVADPSTLPGGWSYSTSFSFNGTYLAVGSTLTPFLTIYKRSGDTFTKLANPTLPGSDTNEVRFSFDDKFLAVAHETSPYVNLYRRNGDTFTKLANPTGGNPAGIGQGIAFSPDGRFLAVGHNAAPTVTVYKIIGEALVKMPTMAPSPGTVGYGVAFSWDSRYLVTLTNTSPYIGIWEVSGDSFTPMTAPTLAGIGESATFSTDGTYMVIGHRNAPRMSIFKLKEGVTKQWIATDFEVMNPETAINNGDLEYRFL